MQVYVNTASLRDEPLRLKRRADADYSVMVKDLRAGRIVAGMTPGMVMMWEWTITGPYIPVELQPSNGREETLNAAKIAFKAKFEAWQAWAEGFGHDVIWHG